MLTKLSVVLLVSASLFAAKDYENFDLPKSAATSVPDSSSFAFKSNRVQIRGGKVKFNQPNITHQNFVFMKEAYVSEKRDQAIKLIRQEMDSGYKKNRDNMLLRLGQLYAEKYMEMSYRESELFGKQQEEYEKIKSTGKGVPPKLDNSRSKKYLTDALKIFYDLEKEFPRHPRMDEVVFFIGFVELESGNSKKGVGYLERVVRSFPNSRKWDEAALYLGDHYFDSQKFTQARQRYTQLLKRDTGLRDYAEYKLAWCELNIGDAKRALGQMKNFVIRLASTADQSKFNLRDQAMRDLVIFYGETEMVDDAMKFFTERQGKDKALENLRLMADIFRSKGRDAGAVAAYKRLLAEFGDSLEAPRLYLGLYDSESRLGRNKEAVKYVITAVEKYGANSDWAKSFPSEKAADLKATIETLQSEALKIAFYHHNAAQKSANKIHYEHAMKIYSALLQNFPDHPDRKKVAFFLGEAQFHQGKWTDAANAYLIAAKIQPKDKLSEEAAYNALLAVDRLSVKAQKLERYSKAEQKDVDTTPQSIPDSDKKFLEVAEFYRNEYPNGARSVDVEFRIAAVYYTYHHFDEALEAYKNIALKHPTHRSATTAAHIVLDIYNIKKDYDSMVKTAGVFAGTKNLGDQSFRNELAQITSEIDFKKIEPLEKQNKWVDAGDNYFSFYQKNPSGPLAEKSLYNAYVSYEKAGDKVKASQMSRLFVSKYPKSGYASQMMLAQAKYSEDQYDFDQAQKSYHAFYKQYPTNKEAKKALYNSAVFAELLEQNKTALSLYEEYLREAKPSAEERKAIYLSQAKIHRKEKNWDRMASVYRTLIRDARNSEEKLNYLGEMARQYDRGGRTPEKIQVLNEIRVLSEGRTKLGLAAPFVAEAKLKAVTKQREKYAEIKFRFPPEDLIYLMKRKEKALVKLAKGYDEVVDVGVPEWGVAALYEKSEAYDDYVKSYRTLEIPKRYKGEEREVIQKSLKDIDAKMVAPLEAKSKEILKVCATRSTEFKVISEFAGKCRDRVAGNSNQEQPKGLVPQPNYWSIKSVSGEVAKR